MTLLDLPAGLDLSALRALAARAVANRVTDLH